MERNEGDCSNCPSRWFCSELCDPARWYVDQDYVSGDLPVELIPPRPLPTHQTHPKLTPTELKIVRCFVIGSSPYEISEILGITVNSVYTHKYRIKKKYIEM